LQTPRVNEDRLKEDRLKTVSGKNFVKICRIKPGIDMCPYPDPVLISFSQLTSVHPETIFGHMQVSNSEIGNFGLAQGNQRIALKTYA